MVKMIEFLTYFLLIYCFVSLYTRSKNIVLTQGKLVFEIELKNFRNEQFYGEVILGTPPKIYKVIFDTGSNFLWVKGSDWKFYHLINKDIKNAKNIKKSYLYIKYGTGSIMGQPISGYFSLGFGNNTYSNSNMKFGITLYEDSKVFTNVII